MISPHLAEDGPVPGDHAAVQQQGGEGEVRGQGGRGPARPPGQEDQPAGTPPQQHRVSASLDNCVKCLVIYNLVIFQRAVAHTGQRFQSRNLELSLRGEEEEEERGVRR